MTNFIKRMRKRTPICLLMAALLLLAMQGSTVRADGRSYTHEEAEIIAKVIWGEARGCDATQQAAVAWCILNRVGSDGFPNSIIEVAIQKYQFAGYRPDNPVEPDILALVYDVLARWTIEPSCVAGVGRVLPESYLYFSGNGAENTFRESYQGGDAWDWSLASPYEMAEEGSISGATESNPLSTRQEYRPALRDADR